jgi:hypothetical protein
MENGEEVLEDVLSISMHSSDCATYRSMYTFGNHFRVVNVESHLSTQNSGVVANLNKSVTPV